MPLPHRDQVAEIKSSLADAFARKQRRQMLTALTLLLVALILTLIKDREFWFPTAPVQSESEPLEETSPQPNSLEAVTTIKQPALPRRRKAKQRTPRTGAQPDQSPAAAPIIMSRTVLPPLEVEVVAGDEHREVQAGSNSVKVDLRPGTPVAPTEASSATPESAPASVADATTRMHLSPGTSQILSRPVEPKYPLLAKQMKIQGAVVLQVLIGRDGTIQHLHVLSGPTILSAAAREAVKQWRFKPYLESGEAVETTARVTVNFTIWT